MTQAVLTTTIYDTYEPFVQGLIDHANNHHEWLWNTLNPGKATYLRDCRTIGINLPRQMGKTRFLVSQFQKHPKSLMIVANPAMRRDLIMTTLYNRGSAAPFELTDEECERILIPNQVKELINADNPERLAKMDLSSFTHTFIDDSSYFFSAVRIKKFYDFLASHVSETHLVITTG